MEMFFILCAAFGGTFLLCQSLAGLIGLGGDHGGTDSHDVGHDVGHDGGHDAGHETGHETGSDHGDSGDSGQTSWYFGLLSFRALATALTFFGLGGLAAHYGGLSAGPTVALALVAGGASLYAVASMMRMLAGLKADGTVRLNRAVGQTGTVYVRIPGARAGAGKVTLVLQSRTVEVAAVTSSTATLPTGSKVKVVSVLDPSTVEVIPEATPEVTSAETTIHA